MPVPWDTDGIRRTVSGRDFIESVIAENVTRFRVERLDNGAWSTVGRLSRWSSPAPLTGETVSLRSQVAGGGARSVKINSVHCKSRQRHDSFKIAVIASAAKQSPSKPATFARLLRRCTPPNDAKRNRIHSNRVPAQSGYILLPVIVVITLVAAIALLMNTESALESNTAASELDAQQAQYVAEAGLNHGLSWLAPAAGLWTLYRSDQ